MKSLLRILHLFCILSILLLMYTGCTLSTGDDIAGTGSQAGNGKVVATVLGPEEIPVIGAEVYIRKSDFLKDTTEISSTKISDAITDSKGSFELDSVIPGTYFIEINDGIANALLMECVKESTSVADSNVTDLGNLVLQPVASFNGTVERENISDMVAIYIQMYGLDRAQKADTSGKFLFTGVPSGMFALKITSSDSSLGIVDNETVKVDPAENVDIGRFSLPFEYWRDTLVVRAILDSNGQFDVPVAEVITMKNGRIDVLNLTKKDIRRIPPIIKELRITQLYLAINSIDFLPLELGHLPSLGHLDLRRNKIRGIPPSIGNLKKLKYFDISENSMRMLHPEIGKCTSLEYLNLRQNEIKKLPGAVGYLVNLEFLDLSENSLDSLPAQITDLTELDFLSVNYNYLVSVPWHIEQWLDSCSTDKEWRVTQGTYGRTDFPY